MNKFNMKSLGELNLRDKFSRELVDNYLQRFEMMKILCVSFAQLIFSISYSNNLHIAPKYEHIHVFKYNFCSYLNSISGSENGKCKHKVVWVRSFDSNNSPYFQFVVLVNNDSLSHWQELIETAKRHWGMVLGSDDPHPISVCNNQNARKELVSCLTYSQNCSELERIRQEKKMLQQILVLAKLIDQERPYKDGWMERSNRPGELRHII